MNQISIIHSVDTGFTYAVLKSLFSKQYKYSVLIILYAIAQWQTA